MLGDLVNQKPNENTRFPACQGHCMKPADVAGMGCQARIPSKVNKIWGPIILRETVYQFESCCKHLPRACGHGPTPISKSGFQARFLCQSLRSLSLVVRKSSLVPGSEWFVCGQHLSNVSFPTNGPGSFRSDTAVLPRCHRKKKTGQTHTFPNNKRD